MPSVRVKRGYTFLEDPETDERERSTRSLRSRSLTEIFTPSVAANPRNIPPAVRSIAPAHAFSNGYQNEGRLSSLQRPPSKVSQHCLTRGRSQSLNLANQDDYNPYLSPGAGRRRFSLIQHYDPSDMMSLQGQQADVMVPADEQEPGRVGRALSVSHSERYEDIWDDEHHDDDIVEHLDVVDPQIATVSTLTNAANAIVIPPLSFYSRKPVVVLPRRPRGKSSLTDQENGESHHEDNLDQHVQDVLTKRDQFRRVMQGVWSFVKTPLGIVTAIYGFLVVFWGTALVFFLAKFIDLHNSNTQGFWVELCQQILTSLFSITSIGLIPFRIEDTYRIYKIWYYKRRTRLLRKKAGLPELYDEDDLPDPVYDANYVHVLSEKEQIDLHYHQRKFMKSQTWYRPHGTQTHRAFPIHIAILICVLNDLNSLFQCLLSGCMWSMNRFQRPAWTTATTLPAAFLAGILAGFYIYWGGRKTKRVKEVTERLRIALAMESPKATAQESESGGEISRILETPEAATLNQEHRRKNFAIEEQAGDQLCAEPAIHIADEMTVPAVSELAGYSR